VWELLAIEQYDEGISEDNGRVDIDGLEGVIREFGRWEVEG
jgi:hypothetical protein